jgi:Fe-S-cluster containining protein
VGARAVVRVSPLEELRRRVDAAVADTRAKASVSCPTGNGIGCSGCCRGEVAIHPAEWAALLPAIPEAAWARVRAAVPALLTESRTAMCPLLDPETRGCSVYAERPGACRSYLVVSPREWCYPEISGPRKTAMPKAPLIALGQGMLDLLPGGVEPVELLGHLLVAELDRRGSDAA